MTLEHNTIRMPSESELEEAMARARKIRAEAFHHYMGSLFRFVFGKSEKPEAAEKSATHWSGVRPWGPTPSV